MRNRITIEPGRIEKNYWRDLWQFRELFYILSWRDIKVRYKQTVIGIAWSVIRPLLTAIIFTIIFNKVAKLDPPPGVPYAILVFAGMLPWQFFANALSESSSSLVGNANLVSKIYGSRVTSDQIFRLAQSRAPDEHIWVHVATMSEHTDIVFLSHKKDERGVSSFGFAGSASGQLRARAEN